MINQKRVLLPLYRFILQQASVDCINHWELKIEELDFMGKAFIDSLLTERSVEYLRAYQV